MSCVDAPTLGASTSQSSKKWRNIPSDQNQLNIKFCEAGNVRAL